MPVRQFDASILPELRALGWAGCLLGFGLRGFFDGILSHWVLGIHRIRLDTEHVLFWDVLWFAVFGVAFVVLGWWLRRGEGTLGGRSGAGVLVLAVLFGGPVAALPPPDSSTVMVFYKPGTLPAQVFAGIEAVDGRILWSSPAGDVWALDVKDRSRTALLYQHGAWVVSNSALAAGCLAWTSARG